MTKLKASLLTLLAIEATTLLVLFLRNVQLATDLFLTVFCTPLGMSHLVSHGHSLVATAMFGMIGGPLYVLHWWLLAYYVLECSPWVKKIVQKLWVISPAETKRSGWVWKLPYVGFAIVSLGEVWPAILTAKVFRLDKWVVLRISLVVSVLKVLGTTKFLSGLSHLNPFAAHIVRTIIFAAFVAFVTVSIFWKIRTRILSARRKPREAVGVA